MSRTLCLAAALLLPPLQAGAQLRTLEVPEGMAVVVAPRSAPPAGSVLRARPLRPAADAEPWPDELSRGSSPFAYALVPLLAGAVAALATTLPGGGGGASGPVRTR